ncbi:MAG: ABC transporter ATP-binding protein [Pseudomonadota bacterium]
MTGLPTVLNGRRARFASLVAAAGIGQALCAGIAAFATRDVFAALAGSGPLPLAALCLLTLAGAGIALLRVVSRTLAERLGHDFAIEVRATLYRHLAGMSREVLAQRRAGALGLRFVGDLTAARSWVASGLTRLLAAGIVLPGGALVLAALNPTLAVAAAVPLLVTLVAMAAFSVGVRRLHRRLRARRARIAISMLERAAMAPDLDVMGRTAQELSRLQRLGMTLRRSAVERIRAVAGLRAVPDLGVAVAGAALLWAAHGAGATAADSAGALAVLGILSAPLRELAGVWDRRCAWLSARRKLESFLATPSELRRRARRPSTDDLVLPLGGASEAGAMLNLPASCRVLLSGPPGAGHGSLVRAATGLNGPTRAARGVRPGTPPPATLLVAPDAAILRGSLRRALTLGVAPRPDDATLRAAAAEFGLSHFAAGPDGLDLRLGEAGRPLNAGERLRVHLVRASLAVVDLVAIDASETLLDELTRSALRTFVARSEARVLIAASDPSLVDLADRHLVVDGDGLAEATATAWPQGDAREAWRDVSSGQPCGP